MRSAIPLAFLSVIALGAFLACDMAPMGQVPVKDLAPDYSKEAIQKWQKVLQLDPSNQQAIQNLMPFLIMGGRIQDAIKILETSLARNPDDKQTIHSLADLYLKNGQKEKGIACVRRVINEKSTATERNTLAYKLAEADAGLDLAKELSEKAVQEMEVRCSKTSGNDRKDIVQTGGLLAFWDTLGWVYFRTGDFAQAEKYMRSAWCVSQKSVSGEHLAEIYERQGKKDEAKAQRALLEQDLVAKQRLGKMRTFHLPIVGKKGSDALILLVFTRKGLESAKFLSGDETLKAVIEQIKLPEAVHEFPDEGPEKIVQQATLTCGPNGSTLTLMVPFGGVIITSYGIDGAKVPPGNYH